VDYVHRKDLIAPEKLRELMQKSDAKAWRQLLSHFGAIGLSGYLLYLSYGTLWMIPVFILHGMLLNFLYAAQHELMHLTVFRARRLNNLVSRITGFIVMFPRDYDRFMHFTHHRYTNLPGKDPELIGYNEQNDNYSLGSIVWRLSCIPYWMRRIGRLFRVAAGKLTIEGYMTSAEQTAIIREARWHLAGYAAIAAISVWQQSWFAVIYWLAPLMLTKCLHEVQNIVEHNGLPKVDNVLANTRTIHTNRFMHWLAWNMQYHCDHHLFAAVPFYNLPALHAELKDNIQNVAPNYRAALKDALFRPRAQPLAQMN
jgi:fatty acid desaturase